MIILSSNLILSALYRVMSLCNIAKVFKIVLYNHNQPSVGLQTSPSQHGFVNNKLTVTNLAVFTQFVSHAIDKLDQVDVIYTDFSKAFDRIDYHIIITKLDRFSFSTSLIQFLRLYLSD